MITNTSAFRHETLMMITRLAIPRDMKIFKTGARVVGSFMKLSAMERLYGCTGC